MGRVYELPEPRHDHVVVKNPRIPKVRLRHPSMMFDQDSVEVNAASDCVLLTKLEAQLIASLLNVARGHLPSPKAVDDAISLLVGKR